MMGVAFPSLTLGALYHVFAVAIVGVLVTFTVKLYRARCVFLNLRKKGLPMPPWNPIFGHLIFARSLMSKLPSDCHPHYLAAEIRRRMPQLGPIFYLDTWPFGPQMLIVVSPTGAYQITQKHSLPKYSALRQFMYPLTNGYDLLTMEGPNWKSWRAIFNPGFSTSHLMTLVPSLVEDTSIFCEILKERARKGVVAPLEEATISLTMDVIGRVALDTQLNTQRSRNPMAKALRDQIPWLGFGNEINPLRRYHPFRPFFRWYNKRIIDRYVSQELDHRYQSKAVEEDDKPKRARSIIDLALDMYLAGNESTRTLNPTFKQYAMNQVILFIFAGHDTTSSTICYALYLLSIHSEALSSLRAEHDSVFGTDLSQTASSITKRPHLLNQLPYSLAVIKETLRLFPAASSTRSGEPGFHIVEDDKQFPTEGFLVWSLHQALHRDPTYWSSPNAFMPERWLVPAGDPLYPVKDAWRPFEFGPRSCLGQELAMLELKVVLVMVVRLFDIQEAYGDWDKLRGYGTKNRTVAGERAYQVGMQHPSEGFPCRVSIRNGINKVEE